LAANTVDAADVDIAGSHIFRSARQLRLRRAAPKAASVVTLAQGEQLMTLPPGFETEASIQRTFHPYGLSNRTGICFPWTTVGCGVSSKLKFLFHIVWRLRRKRLERRGNLRRKTEALLFV